MRKRLYVVPVLIDEGYDAGVAGKLINAIEGVGGEVISPSTGTTRILSWDPILYRKVAVTVTAPHTETETREIPGHVQGKGVS